MGEAEIFVSHSAKHRDIPGDERLRYARSVLELIDEELGNAGFITWIDRHRLNPGDGWNAKIHEALNTCVGAVIVLDPVVLEESDWVLAEATVLAHRYATSPDFRLVPVLLGGARPASLQLGRWAPLRLSEIQPVRDNWSAVVEDQTCQAPDVARQVAAAFRKLAPLAANPLLGWWLNELTELLRPLAGHRLEGAARALRLDLAGWEAQGRRVDLLAYALLDGDRETIPKAVGELAPLANERPDPIGEPLAAKVTPLWVRLEMASGLARGMRGASGTRRMLVSTSDPDLASDIIHRAVYSSPGLRVARCTGETGGSLTLLVETCSKAIAKKLISFGLRNAAPDVIEAKLADAVPPPCAVINADGLDEDEMKSVADQLSQRFPGVVLVLLSTSPEKVGTFPVVEPLLTQDEADSAKTFRCQILELAGQECPDD